MNELRFTSAARRDLNRLPLGVVDAALNLISGPLLENPRRLGKQLGPPLERTWSARVGEYRVLYRLETMTDLADPENVGDYLVTVVAIRHRRDSYRT